MKCLEIARLQNFHTKYPRASGGLEGPDPCGNDPKLCEVRNSRWRPPPPPLNWTILVGNLTLSLDSDELGRPFGKSSWAEISDRTVLHVRRAGPEKSLGIPCLTEKATRWNTPLDRTTKTEAKYERFICYNFINVFSNFSLRSLHGKNLSWTKVTAFLSNQYCILFQTFEWSAFLVKTQYLFYFHEAKSIFSSLFRQYSNLFLSWEIQ